MPKKTAQINLYNIQHNKTGMWWIEVPETLDIPAYTECGVFENGNKTGGWYKVDEDGNISAYEHYKNNVLDGEVRYYEKGKLNCIGHYRGLNTTKKMDTIIVVDPVSGKEKSVSIPTERGTLKHGIWQFYDIETGQLIKEEEYQIDELVYRKENKITPMDSLTLKNRIKTLTPSKKKNHFYRHTKSKESKNHLTPTY